MKACVEPCGERKECSMSCTAHACRTCVCRPAVVTARTRLPRRLCGAGPPAKGNRLAQHRTSSGSSSRRAALGRPAMRAADERVLMLRCGVICWRGCRRRGPVVTRPRSCCARRGGACCVFAAWISHTRARPASLERLQEHHSTKVHLRIAEAHSKCHSHLLLSPGAFV